jgi:hypothetical protein
MAKDEGIIRRKACTTQYPWIIDNRLMHALLQIMPLTLDVIPCKLIGEN